MVPGLTVSSTEVFAFYQMLRWGRWGGEFSQLHLVNQKLLHRRNSLMSFFPYRSIQGDLNLHIQQQHSHPGLLSKETYAVSQDANLQCTDCKQIVQESATDFLLAKSFVLL